MGMINEFENILIKTDGVVNYDLKKYIEVQPGIFSHFFVNVKATLADSRIRHRLAEALARRVNRKSVCICGIESGGSYYAAAVADLLQKPLVLFRKESKKYGIGQRFVGNLPSAGRGLVTMIDDVIAGGMISTANNKELAALGFSSELLVVFSFLPQLVGPMSAIRISALSNVNGLCLVGRELGLFKESDVTLIKKERVWSNV